MNNLKLLFDNSISISSIILSIIALIVSFRIYKKQKVDNTIITFYSEFARFLATATKPDNDANIILINLKITSTLLDKKIFEQFIKILPIIEHLNLTDTNPKKEEHWNEILSFLTISSNFYNLTICKDEIKKFLKENL